MYTFKTWHDDPLIGRGKFLGVELHVRKQDLEDRFVLYTLYIICGHPHQHEQWMARYRQLMSVGYQFRGCKVLLAMNRVSRAVADVQTFSVMCCETRSSRRRVARR